MTITYQNFSYIMSLAKSDPTTVIMRVRISIGRSPNEVHTLEVDILLTNTDCISLYHFL